MRGDCLSSSKCKEESQIMKKPSIKKIIVCALAAATAASALCACNDTSSETTYVVTFDTRGGSSISSMSLTPGSSISRPSQVPTKEWFKFDDWYTDTTYTQKFEFGSIMPDYNITIYAGWYGEANVNVTYDANGGAFDGGKTTTAVLGDVGAAFTPIANPQKDGYKFGGWYTDPECKNSYTFTVYPVEDLTLYAGWANDSNYAYVSYYGNGSLVKTVPVRKGNANTEPKIFGDDILSTGWYTDKALESEYTFGAAINNDISLYTSYYTKGLKFSGDTVTVYDGSSRAVVVPSKIDGEVITTIGENAFYRTSELPGITSVSLPDTVTTISKRAFYDCKYLVTAGLTENVTEIGEYAFYRNERLKSVGDISKVTSIGKGAFQGCKVLDGITLPETLSSLGSYAFEGCTSLTAITVPVKVTAIGEYTFSGCTSLKTADIASAGLTAIAEYAFEHCAALESLTIRSVITTEFKTLNGVGPIDDCAKVTIYVPSSLLGSYKIEYAELQEKFAAI